MMEQIRKFLIQPNIVILFAVKIDQLELSKCLSLMGEYEIMLQHELLKNGSVINEMAEAYLTKLLPHQQRIYMPEGSVYFQHPVTIIHADDKKKDEYSSVRQMITELIYRKTRYLFYNTTDKTSYIVPDNLRELRLLVGLLYNMEDYWAKSKNEKSNIYNKLQFRKYLYENWVTNNLDAAMQVSVREILNTQDYAQINAIVLAGIKRHFFVKPEALSEFIKSHPADTRRILDKANINYNIAIGDVLDIIDYLEESETDTLKLKFLFLLRSFYSMSMYQAYDSVTEKESSAIDPVLSPTRLSDLNLSEYDKLVAGYYINTRLSRIIPAGQASQERRSERNINFIELLQLIDEVIKEHGTNTDKLCLVEFFMLGISRRYDTQDENTPWQYRKAAPAFYAESLENLVKNAYFDVGALMYNLTRIEACYRRFNKGEQIYDLACRNNDSLLNKFRMYAIERKADPDVPKALESFNELYWKSCSCFRNAEIIKAFKAHAERFKSPGVDHLNIISRAFKHMSEFHINTYDKLRDGSYYEVVFDYLKYIGELLKQSGIKNDFMKIFVRDDSLVPEVIDCNIIIRGASMWKNKKDTRIKKIYDNYPVISKNYRDVVNTVMDKYDEYMTRDELTAAINEINIALEIYRSK